MIILAWLRQHLLIGIALILLMITSCWHIPQLRSIDWLVIAVLFNLMLVVNGLIRCNLLEYLALKILQHCRNERDLVLALSVLCFISSMFITNDVALLLFVPLTLIILRQIDINGVQLVVLETLAANLGSAFSPLGNPQNLFIYSYFKFSMLDFLIDSFPLLIVGGLFLLWLVRKTQKQFLQLQIELPTINKLYCGIYCALFALVLASVAGMLNYLWVTLLVVVVNLIIQPQQFKRVDYPLLILFIIFFLLIGNLLQFPELMSNIQFALSFPAADYWLGLGLSQVISNVPAALLLAPVNRSPQLLLWGVNVGGMGTLIASMASLISYRLYVAKYPDAKGKYLSCFYNYNFTGLVIFSIVLSCLAFLMRYLSLLNF